MTLIGNITWATILVIVFAMAIGIVIAIIVLGFPFLLGYVFLDYLKNLNSRVY